MKGIVLFLPLAALVVFAGYLGLRAGQVPSETELINRYAAAYLASAPHGAKATDCAARPHADEAVRMVITCAAPNGVTTHFFVGPRGEALPVPQGPSA